MRHEHRNALICAHLGLVEPIARAIGRHLPACFDSEDLIAAGFQGLIRAAERYIPEDHAGAPFEAFARPWIRGAILSSVRKTWSDGKGRHALRPLPDSLATAFCARDTGADQEAITEAIDDAGRLRAIARVIGTLPDAQAALLRAIYVAGAPTVRAAAARLGMPYGRAWRLHAAGIGALRARFAQA